jgi:acetylornithine aminotransferase/acetylornithine/N-succinyldiaminopimelate aminotransferase
MSKLQSIQAAERKLMLQTYERNPYLFVSGVGVYLRDENGVDYLDLLSGIGCSALGYSHPAMNKAITEQGTRLIHTSNLFYTEHTAELALRLTEISGLDRVFFCNSGTEAWEGALKLARAHAKLLNTEGRKLGTKFLALDHSFHGRTMGSVSTTHKAKYREPFNPLIPTVEFVAFNDVADLRARFSDEICAICIEPIQGEGGIHPVSREFLETARALCDSTGALLLADEIQCGLGRTGKWFAFQHTAVRPDVVTLAKPIAGGIPMGALLATEEAARAFTPGMHGTTFGGNPFACAVAIAVIDTIRKDNLLAHIEEVGAYFKLRLQALADTYSSVKEVRAVGLMLGLELHSEEVAKKLATQMMENRIILNRTSETVLRFLPPYILEKKHVDIAVDQLEALLKSHEAGQSELGATQNTNSIEASPVLAGGITHG